MRGSSFEQCAGDFRVVDALEETKKANTIGGELIVRAIVNGANTSEQFFGVARSGR